ncbi:flavin-dependent oxidoreductase [Nonomuraea sp. NPDC059007]|uniref:flavin-dependent oxidoreductase n=1 Tax=Nonomuraea sp. NPDC059007 TaxID=3346692 RepID=UPI0036C90903
MHVLIAGAGIGGLTTALSLHAAGLDAVLVEQVADLRPIGAGINLQPHAVKELSELGLAGDLEARSVATAHMRYVDRHGNMIMDVPRGRAAGYRWPQYSIHRGRLQMLLLDAVRARLGPSALVTGRAERFEQDRDRVRLHLDDGRVLDGDVLVGCDGLHSAVRARLHPGEGAPLWNGVRMWRGTAAAQPYLDGRTMIVSGANEVGKFVCYPIGDGLVNWVAELRTGTPGPVARAGWNVTGRHEDVLEHFGERRFPWLDVAGLIARSPQVWEFPMVDRDPLPWWTRGRVTLLGDAAHPMYPIGSNGGSQTVVDARVLAYHLATTASLAAYESERRAKVNRLVENHRRMAVEEILDEIARRAPGGFGHIDEVLSAEERARLHGFHARVTDMEVAELNAARSWTVAPTGTARAPRP